MASHPDPKHPADFTPNVTANVETLEARARELEEQEIDRSRALDQKTAALIAACIVVLGAGVAFAARLADIAAGGGARTLWAALLSAGLILIVGALGYATAAIRPQTTRTAIHIDELRRWLYEETLGRHPVEIRGELMAASVDAVGEARVANAKKARLLLAAYLFFLAALVATLGLGIAVSVRQASPAPTMTDKKPKSSQAAGPSEKSHPQPREPQPMFRTPKRDHALRESEYSRRDGR